MPDDASTASSWRFAAVLEPDSRLGPYRIEQQIGRGGMSIVYAALHVPLARQVALKVLLPALAGEPEFVERFLSEARAAAHLDYPHIVPIYDSGEIEGVNYIAMKLLDGRDLRSILAERRSEGSPGLPLPRAISIASQAAGALEYAHQHRVVHRDVKPANIYVDGQDRATLVDFGIARALDYSSRTVTGTVMGTPAYMSPEQVRGEAVDYRSDIYSLGVVLYEMLAGSAPFQGEPQAVMHAQLTITPPPLSSLRGDVPPGVDEVVQRALAKDPGARYQSAGALALALTNAAGGQLAQQALSGESTTLVYPGRADTGPQTGMQRTGAASVTAAPSPEKPISRARPVLPLLGAAVLVALIVVAGLAWALLAGPLATGDGHLNVSSDPPGANVAVDGNRLGVTPLNALKLATGTHEIQLDKPGYARVKRSETLRPRQTDTVSVTLAPLPAADLLTVQEAVVGKDIRPGPSGTISVGTQVSSVQVEQEFGLVVMLVARNPGEQDINFRYQIVLLDPAGQRLAGSQPAAGTIAKGDPAGRSFAFTFTFHRNSDGTIPTGTYQLEFLVGDQVMVTRPITLVP